MFGGGCGCNWVFSVGGEGVGGGQGWLGYIEVGGVVCGGGGGCNRVSSLGWGCVGGG